MYKIFIMLLAFASLVFGENKIQNLTLSGPFASVSHPFAIMIENQSLKDIANNVEFKLWKNPDQLRAITVNNEADFIAVPTNVAANLYNKGIKIKLLNVSVWGILGMVSTEDNLTNLKDFKGKEIIVPFRSDMPDIVLRALLKKQSIDPKKDINIQYVSTPMDAMQMLILHKAKHALLAEPAISMALRKTKSFPINIVAPTLFRSVDLQTQWAEAYNTEDKIPQAGIAELNSHSLHVKNRFLEEYNKALKWYKEHPKEAGKLVEKYFPMLHSDAVSDSISHIRLNSVNANEAKKDLEFFFNILKEDSPKLIGNKLPDDGFYDTK